MTIVLQFQIRWMSKQFSVYVSLHITVQTFQQLSHFSTSLTRKWCPFGRQDNRKQNCLSCIFMSCILSVSIAGGSSTQSITRLDYRYIKMQVYLDPSVAPVWLKLLLVFFFTIWRNKVRYLLCKFDTTAQINAMKW